MKNKPQPSTQSKLTLSQWPGTFRELPFNPENDMLTKMSGVFEQTIKVGILPVDRFATIKLNAAREPDNIKPVERTFKVYLPKGNEQGYSCLFLLPASGQDSLEFLVQSGWKDIADKYKMFVFVLEPLGGKWDTVNGEYDYVNTVLQTAFGNNTYYIPARDAHVIGYGEGATIVQMAAMKNPDLFSGIATFGSLKVSDSYMQETGSQPTREANVPVSRIPMPVWVVTDKLDADTLKVINYWKQADNSGEKYCSNAEANYIYLPSPIYSKSKLNEDNLAQVRVTISKNINRFDRALNETIWSDFLFRVRRWVGIDNGYLRTFGTPEEFGAVRKFIKFEGINRHWYEYVPISVKNNPDKKVPLVVASHGGLGTGRDYMFASDWFKTAEARGFIVVFPSYYYVKDLVKFAREMVADVKANHNIDASRVYAAGFSGGGQASLIFALTLPDIFTAACANSGLPEPRYPTVEDFLRTYPVRTDYDIPYMFIYGTKQSWLVQYDPKFPDLMNYWINRYQTDKLDKPKTFQTGVYNHRLYYTSGGVPMVRLLSVENMPHTTPPEEPYLVYDQFFMQYYRDTSGKIRYQQSDISE